MALTAVRKQQLAQMDLPSDEEMQIRARSFLRRAGMSQAEIAEQVGIGVASLSLYLNGRYDQHHATEANTLNLRAKLKQYMDLHDVEQVHRLRGTHYETADFQRVRAAVLHALHDGVAYTIDGAPGTQKTWGLLNLAHEINAGSVGRAVYVYVRDGMRPQAFLRECCLKAGISDRGNIDMLIRKLQFFLASERVVLLVDEGNHLDHSTMEILRQMVDNPPYFGVVTAGSHEYAMRLNHYKLEQLHSRNWDTLVLEGPSKAEARAILHARLGMTTAEADDVIADCMATAERSKEVNGRLVSAKYTYISARKLFNVIEAVGFSSATQQQQEAAA